MDERAIRIGNLDIHLVSDVAEMGELAARLVAARVVANPRLTLALPTGKTPLPMYRALVEWYGKGIVDFSRTRFFNLDELLGISRAHPASYAAYLRRELLTRVNASSRRTHLLNGAARHPLQECVRYERRIVWARGLDLAILGIGRNGHIAFNEPGSPFDSCTRVVRLTAQTVNDNGFCEYLDELAQPCNRAPSPTLAAMAFAYSLRYPHLARFECRDAPAGRLYQGAGPFVPEQLCNAHSEPSKGVDAPAVYALTMGIGTILRAREIILLASGLRKAGIVARALQERPATSVPASALQLHPRVTVILDREAAREMELSPISGRGRARKGTD